jgi:hypothetical protein
MKIMKSWIPQQILWDEQAGRVVVPVNRDATGVVEIIAKGALDLPECNEGVKEVVFMLFHENTIWHTFFYGIDSLEPPNDWCRQHDRLPLYLHGIYKAPDGQNFYLIVSLAKGRIEGWRNYVSLQSYAKDIWQLYIEKVQKREKIMEERRRERKLYYESIAHDEKEEHASYSYYGLCEEPLIGEPTFASIMDHRDFPLMLPNGLWISGEDGRIPYDKDVNAAIEATKVRAPRDGVYQVFTAKDANGGVGALVTWEPAGTNVSFPEVRFAAHKMLPRAFNKPLRCEVTPPDYSNIKADDPNIILADLTKITALNRHDFLQISDLKFVQEQNVTDSVHESIKNASFEAFGWYQAFHVYSEEKWGIYLHSKRIQKLGTVLYEDLHKVKSGILPAFAQLIAVLLVYYHEIFHARVEAAASYLEVMSQNSRYNRYNKNVYFKHKFTSLWLEEALANWYALDLIKSKFHDWAGFGFNLGGNELIRVIESYLDMSPEGYCRWRQGDDPLVWRLFASEIARGKQGSNPCGKLIPIESILLDDGVFDWRFIDVPVHFIGSSPIADLCFSTPSRRDAESLLKYFNCVRDKSRGKGSHELWKKYDGQGFPLPYSDPLKINVFGKLLHFLGITKYQYLNEIRPAMG